MSAGYLSQIQFTLPVSGSRRIAFATEGATLFSLHLKRDSGLSDATFKCFTGNFKPADVAGAENNLTGSVYGAYWYPEPNAAGVAFTGSATDAPASYIEHFDSIGTKAMLVEFASNAGGVFTFFPHLKRG